MKKKNLSNLEYPDKIKSAELTEYFNGMSIEIKKKEKLLQLEQWAYLSTHPSKRLNSFCYDGDDEDYTLAVTPILSTEEPDNSLSMGDEHLDTIPATESDEFIKSSVEDLISIPSESKGIPEHKCDVPSHDNSPPLDGDILLLKALLNDDHSSDFKTKSFSTSLNSLLEETNKFDNSLPEFTTFSNVLFDAEYESDSSDDQSCSDEDDNSSPRPPKEFVSANSDAEIESFSPSPILVKDSDSLMEEIDLTCTPDYPMLPGIEDDDYDSERDILIRKDLPSNNTLSFAEKESFHFDILPFSHGDTGILNIKMMGDIYGQKAFMHKLMITLAPHQEKSPDLLSHRGLKAFQPFATCPMMIHG
nr:hypothetical protein [Tanacetum cinerariifolium]